MREARLWQRLQVLGLALMTATGIAQMPAATDALEHGRLVVWVVGPVLPPQPTSDQERARLHTATAGTFGRTAGSAGQTAGSYGRSPSTLPPAVTSQSAGDVGQTAGSFGQSLSTIADASMVASGAVAPEGAGPVFEPARLSPGWDRFGRALQGSFNDLKVSFVAVSPVDLQARLATIGHGVEQPDVLMSEGALPERQFSFLREVTLASLGTRPESGPSVAGADEQGHAPSVRPWWIFARAAHPEEARAFVVWLADGMRPHLEQQPLGGPVGGPAALAMSAVQSALAGGEISGRDAECAAVPAGAMQIAAFTPPTQEVMRGAGLRIDVLAWAANERFAVYGLRAIASAPRSFGVAHPLVVLRRGQDGRWRVLQVSANLSPDRLEESFSSLRTSAGRVRPELVKAVAAVTLASPGDGDTRTGSPELWWDNPGDARLLAVEWQRPGGDTHLFLVPDNGPRLQVRVTAGFADRPGVYRWRVWAVGNGGTTKLSLWRKVNVVQ